MAAAERKKINLALQGGGAHGAYSWGVLDRLLQDERIVIEGISGTSAGAMNAAVLVSGYDAGGREGARTALRNFWKAISETGSFSPLRKTPWEQWLWGWNLDWSPAYHWLDMLSRIASPYDLNPLNINPLRGVLEGLIDMEGLRESNHIKLFLSATHVESGQARVFHKHEVTADVLLASACIPFLFQAVAIDGEEYWDGGYMGNPALWPLIYNCQSEDLLLIQINPIHRPQRPRSASDIINRLNEITFNSSLIAEMRAIEFVKRLLDEKRLPRESYKDMKIHLIYSADELKALNASSKVNTGWDFFQYLHGVGVAAADQWIAEHFHKVGKRSSIDIREKFLCGPGKRSGFSSLGKKKHQRKQQQESAEPLE